MRTLVFALPAAFVLVSPVAAQVAWGELERDRAPLTRIEPRAARALSAGDCTGDGLPDLFAANNRRGPFVGTNLLLRNVGAERFVDASGNLPANDDFSSTVLAGDLDGDSDLDGVVLGGRTVVLQNDGFGVFTDVTAATLPASYPIQRHDTGVLGDFDGDGDLDLVSLGVHTDSYLHNNGGVFTPGTPLPFLRNAQGLRLDAISAWDAIATDLDGNGTLDLVIGCVGRVLFFAGNGNGTFVDASAQLGLSLSSTVQSVAAGDIDGDGDRDLVFTLWGNPSFQRTGVVVLQNNGIAPFTDVSATALPNTWNAHCVVLTDLDLDGAPDLVVGRQGSTIVARNQGNGTFAIAPAAMQPSDSLDVIAITVTDFANDGWPDLAMVPLRYQNWGRVETFHNAHGSALVPLTTTRLPQEATGASQLQFVDLDGDGDDDLLQANFGNTSLLVNDGDGSFTDGSATFSTAAGAAMHGDCFAVGDIDGDGLKDVVFAGNQKNMFVFRNQGAGIMVDETSSRLLAPLQVRLRLVLGDVDGDADLDIVTAAIPAGGLQSPGDEVFLNDGTGVFTRFTTTHIPFDLAPKFGLAAADLDGDGDLDLAFVGTSGLRYLENGGSGTFTDVTAARAPVATFYGVAVEAIDLEPDGDLDLLIGHTTGTLVYVNQGNGMLTDESALRLPPDAGRTWGFASLELLHSGLQGLIVAKDATTQAGGLVTWVNLGGFFADVSTLFGHDPDATRALAVSDVDQDGDVDIVTTKLHGGANSRTRILLGLETQLHTPRPPLLGGQLDFTIFARGLLAPSAAIVVISFAPQQPRLTVPPLGTLGVDLALALLLPPVPFSPTGEATVTVPIPNVAGLHGVRLWCQAVVQHGPSPSDARLTNVRTETLSF